jgi:hypothetical protein
MKPGWRTSEFWMTTAVNLWTMLGGAFTPEQQAIIVGVVTGVYTITRGLAKGMIIRGEVGEELRK